MISSSVHPIASASSRGVGDRPRVWVRSAVVVPICSRSSCRRRGTRIAQPLSRKYRLISPMIVGVAYVENSTPRSRSKRSIDLISPIVPTCTRSSNGSPRLRKRRAQCSTRGRCTRDQAVACGQPGRLGRRQVAEPDEQLGALLAGLVGEVTWAPMRRALDARGLRVPVVGHLSRRPPGAASRPSLEREARVGGEGHLEVVLAGVRGRLRGQGAQDLPGEALVVGLGAPLGLDADRHREGAGGLPELGLEVSARGRLGQHQRAGLADRDPEVLDVVDGEVEPSREARGHGAEHRDVGAVGRALAARHRPSRERGGPSRAFRRRVSPNPRRCGRAGPRKTQGPRVRGPSFLCRRRPWLRQSHGCQFAKLARTDRPEGLSCAQAFLVSQKISAISSILASSSSAFAASSSPLVPVAPASLVASLTRVCSCGYFSKCGGLK